MSERGEADVAPDAPRVLGIPAVSLVVLIGASGAGKSTFAARHFAPFEVISSDFCRGLVSNDENDQAASAAAFEVLHFIVAKRLAAGLLTVVDATNVQPRARKALVEVARAHDVLPVAVILDVPERVCIDRNEARSDRPFGAPVIKRQRDQLRRSLRGLSREGFRKVHTLDGVDEIEHASFERQRLLTDYRDQTGPFDVVGDVHGCRVELQDLLVELGYSIQLDGDSRAINATHPEGRRVIFVGDLVDRGPDSPGVLRLAMGMVRSGNAFAVPGNHENKLVRALRGRNVQVSHGLAETLEQLGHEPAGFRDEVEEFCDGLVSHLVLDGGRLVVAHAGLKEAYQGRASRRVRSFALYGDTTGETDEFGLPVRYPWANDYRGSAMVLYGHTPTLEPEWINNTMCLDTGVVFGGKLTALRYPEKDLVSVPARKVYYEPTRPFIVDAERSTVADSTQPLRDDDVLDVADVMGKRVVETGSHGRITIKEENAVGALEVMSRFAMHPRWLMYLPPTMTPCVTSARSDYLEYPTEAIDQYRTAGVTRVICEEKHMGSRAVVLICRDRETAIKRFGSTDGRTGAVYTRTGRPFFDLVPTEEILARLRAALTACGMWEELDTDWVLLDCELLPWSAKAIDLLRNQYAAVGAAARAALPTVIDELERAAASGLGVDDLLRRTRSRLANAAAFTDAYRRYCWPVEGVAGVKLAPFQVLASDGATYENRDHGWHLEMADRLVGADPDLIQATKSIVVDVDDAQAVEAAIGWWEALTNAGGEGMVVKPFANFTRAKKGLAQPGIKVRGREYLRIIYGPDYTEPTTLDRLRNRSLGYKRSLALREYALGLEALERAAHGQPLWRIHEAVFAVLALETEPVDPRL